MSEKQPLNKPPAKGKEGEEGEDEEEEIKEEEPEPTCGDKCADGIKFVVKVRSFITRFYLFRGYIILSYSFLEELGLAAPSSFIL